MAFKLGPINLNAVAQVLPKAAFLFPYISSPPEMDSRT